MVPRMNSNENAPMKRTVRTCGVILAVTVGMHANSTATLAQNDDKVKAGLQVWKNTGCAECHGSAAEKKFNPDSPEGQMLDSILKGATAEGSKDMPAFAEKGIDEAKAKVLINYMKSIRE